MIFGIKHLSADAIWSLASMGHGDSIAIVDANFPAVTCSKNNRHVLLHGESVQNVVDEVLTLIPLDHAVETPITFMKPKPELAEDQNNLINHLTFNQKIQYLERHDFYKQTNNCFAIISTSTTQPFMNLIIKKGTL